MIHEMSTAWSEAAPFENLLSRQKARARPARTYSKRAAPEALSEPTHKKQRSSPPPSRPMPKPERESLPSLPVSRASTPGLPPLSTADVTKKPPKGTILNFFKPVERLSSPIHSDVIIQSPISDAPASDAPISEIGGETLGGEDDHVDPLSSSPPGPSFRKERVRTSRRLRLKPMSIDPGAESSPVTTSGVELDFPEAKKILKKKRVQASSTVVQTTLNLSSKPAFEECRVCGAVYNPLHPPDVKFHNKIHAAALRATKKAKENQAVDDNL